MSMKDSLDPVEHKAYNAGIRHAISMARTGALAFESRGAARHLRQQAAAAALHGLAEGLKGELLGADEMTSDQGRPGVLKSEETPSPTPVLHRAEAISAGYTGDPCPTCANFTLRRAGTCLACDTCGSTTGCS